MSLWAFVNYSLMNDLWMLINEYQSGSVTFLTHPTKHCNKCHETFTVFAGKKHIAHRCQSLARVLAMDEIWWNPEMLHVGGGKVDIPTSIKVVLKKKCAKKIKADTKHQIQHSQILLTWVGVLKLICMVTGVEYTALRLFWVGAVGQITSFLGWERVLRASWLPNAAPRSTRRGQAQQPRTTSNLESCMRAQRMFVVDAVDTHCCWSHCLHMAMSYPAFVCLK